MPRSRTGLAHDENVLLVRGRFAHPSRIPLGAHAPALRSHVFRRTQLDVRRLLRQQSSHPSAGGAGCVGEAARPRARLRSIPRRSTVHAIHVREPDRGTCLCRTGVSATYLRPIEIFPPPKHARKIFWREGRNGGGGCGGKSDPLIRPGRRSLDRGWSTGEVRSGPSTPSWIAKTVLSFRSFFGLSSSCLPRNGFSTTASEIPCTTQEPGIEIKHQYHRDLRGSFDVMPSKISNRGVVVLACRRSVDDRTAS